MTLNGHSSTGTVHSLLIEQSETELRFTIVGHSGKRHAAVLFTDPSYIADRITDFNLKGE